MKIKAYLPDNTLIKSKQLKFDSDKFWNTLQEAQTAARAKKIFVCEKNSSIQIQSKKRSLCYTGSNGITYYSISILKYLSDSDYKKIIDSKFITVLIVALIGLY